MGKLVLIVEHDQDARRKLRRKLEGRGHAADQEAAVVIGCPRLSDGADELELHLSGLSDGGAYWREPSRLPAEIVPRACDRYRRTGDLVEAAYVLAKGLPPG